MLLGLEVRIGKADEDLAQLCLAEEVREELHRVGPDAGDVLIEQPGLLMPRAQGSDSVLHVLRHLRPNLQPCPLFSGSQPNRAVVDIAVTNVPKRSVSGIFGPSATNSPPKPQPISATSTLLVSGRGCMEVDVASSAAALSDCFEIAKAG